MTYTPLAPHSPLTPTPDYVVPDLKLSPQVHRSTCAIASARMLIDWRRRTRSQTEIAHPSPDEIADSIKPLRTVDESGERRGVAVKHFEEFAEQLGLVAMPLKNPDAQTLVCWLSRYGPLWVAGRYVKSDGTVGSGGHLVVLGGVGRIRDDRYVKIYDPWPVNQGEIRWAPGTHLSLIFKAFASESLEAYESRIQKVRLWLTRQPRTLDSPWETAIFRLPD